MKNLQTIEDFNNDVKDNQTIYIFCYNSKKHNEELESLTELTENNNLQNIFVIDYSISKELLSHLEIENQLSILQVRSQKVVNCYTDLEEEERVFNILSGKRVKKSPSDTPNKGKTVTVYYANKCPYCKQVMRYLDDNKIQYKQVNVTSESRLLNLSKRSRFPGVPQIEINGEFSFGYDKIMLDDLFK